jgi:hypothetical protein
MAKPKTTGPNAIDVHVGNRMRMRRMMLGMTQQALAEAFGLTFQQVQKSTNLFQPTMGSGLSKRSCASTTARCGVL